MRSTTHEVERFRADHVRPVVRPEAQAPDRSPNSGAGAGLKLDFRGVPLETVLNHFHQSAGLIIHVQSNVRTERTVDLWHDKPVSTAEALWLLGQALIEMGCMLIRKGRLFRVIRSQDAKKNWIPLPMVQPTGEFTASEPQQRTLSC